MRSGGCSLWVKVLCKKNPFDWLRERVFLANQYRAMDGDLATCRSVASAIHGKSMDGFFVATYAAVEGRAAFRRNGAIVEPRKGGGAGAWLSS